jgi:hypothetical protein
MNKINLYEEQIFKDDKWLPSWPSSNGEHIEEDVNCPSKMFPKEKKYFENETNRKQFQIKDNQI